MLKRIAGNLFWLTRYLERAEWRARLVDEQYRLVVENPANARDEWWPLLAVTGEWDLFAEHYNAYDERSILSFFTFDPHNSSSIASCIEYARENCRAARNRISSELWLELNTFYLDSRRWSVEMIQSRGLVPFFADLRERFYRVSGVIDGTLPRDSTYDFLSVGKWLEATENITRLLDTRYHFLLPRPAEADLALDLSQWAALLRSASALEPYRITYGNSISTERVVEFMLFDEAFPRAALFCADRLAIALNNIAGAALEQGEVGAGSSVPMVPTAYILISKLREGTAADAIAGGIHEYLLSIQADCAAIGDELFSAYFKFE